ncbi:MAG TPA: alpha-amylase family glycosyl hydrolase [Candidatus Limnocylindrales bacterium]|nr:alpha-amylase family glycosyl hydrolase [Candidatus Limnocylindrales bacterium]
MSSRHVSPAILAAVVVLVAACGGPSASLTPTPESTQIAASPTGAASAAAPTPPACVAPTAPIAVDGWWQDRVFYEVFVRSFADSDGDGIGDLRGLTARLDDLNDGDPATTDDLGVTALWLMPVAESPSYHGYDVTDYRAIERDYGTADDFRALVAAAHQRGIDIVVDLVMNHTSREHPWFVDARTPGSAHDDWYVWSDTQPTIAGPGGRPVWHPDGQRFYYGYFWEGMPDLNLANPAVTAELDAIARFWLEDMGVAGFRLDAARHLLEDGSTLENSPATFTWLEGFRARLKAADPGALVLGEVWDATSIASRYVRAGALDLTFDFGLAGQMLAAVRNGDAGSLRIVQQEVSDAYPAGGYAAFLTNHDQDRVMDVVGRDPAAAKQAATLLLTGAGVPFVYYGEEIGLVGRKPDERIRTPMPWTAEEPGHGFTMGTPWAAFADDAATANVASQTARMDSLLSWYRSLIALRHAHPAFGTAASLTPVDASARSVYAVLRHDPVSGESALVVSNLSDAPVADVTLDLATGPLCGAPRAAVLLGPDLPDLLAPSVSAGGGFVSWPIGDLAAHQDVVIGLGQ